MNEHQPRTGKLLENEALAAEEAGASFFTIGDVELDGGLSEEKGIALREQERPVEDRRPVCGRDNCRQSRPHRRRRRESR